jgi:microsomal dipeptidase-like Zn-dependent dipeptidase
VIADLHAHYAMHLVPGLGSTVELASAAEGRLRRRDRLRARLVGLASRFANYEAFESGPRVTVGSLREGGVGVALSVLYSPFDEMDLRRSYGSPPERAYLDSVLAQADLVEYDLRENHSSTASLSRTPGDIQAAHDARKVAFVHCVEGGFHLGATPEDVERGVERLARRGVAYVTLAHLFWRRIATNAPALPFLPDWLYRRVFPQPEEGLTELGRAAVAAMCRERVLIDVSHMSERALGDTFALLEEIDPDGGVPVIASHAGFRFGAQEYALSEATIERIAARDGVIGLIFAEHQILDGLDERPEGLGASVDVLARHVDRIREITGSHRHAAIGSDFDGFVKPTLPGLQTMADMGPLEKAFEERYGSEAAALICSGNALRPLREYWGGAR